MDKLTSVITIMMIALIGADRINFLGESFDFFIFTPFILLALVFNALMFLFYLYKLNFKWLESLSTMLIIYILSIIVSIFFSIDFYVSAKRFVLLLFMISTMILVLSYYSKKQIIDILIKASIVGSFLFYIFNLILSINWFTFYEISSSIINFDPDEIAYFVPRLGGYSSDVNRGTVILLFFTYILFDFSFKTTFIKFIVFFNSLFVLFSFSRTIYFMILMILIYKIFINTYKGRIRLLKFILGLAFIFVSTLSLLHVYEYVNIELAINERLDVFEISRFSSSGIHLHLIYDGITKAFNDIKILILGSGYGTSFKLIEGYYWSGSKYGNYHSMYITSLVESGLINLISLISLTFIIPLYKNIKNQFQPFIFGLFFFNIFYQLNSEPLFWLIIMLFYKINDEKIYEL